jgi:hypothetical protein
MDKESKKLDKPAKVGAGIFREGVAESLVIEAAQRQYKYNKDTVEEVKIGDKVKFNFSNGDRILGIIKYIPVGPFDSWLIDEIFSGENIGPVFIRNYDYMRLCDS